MSEPRAQVATPVLIVGDAEGDGPILSVIPPPLNRILRSGANRLSGQRIARLTRVAAEIYPILQKIEDRALPEDQKLLQGVPFQKALRDDEKIERALRMYVSAWKSNFIRLLDDKGKAVPPEKGRTYMGACGLTVEQAEMHFIDMALTQIFKDNPKSQARLMGMVHNPDALPKMRVLSQFQPLSVTELVLGLGRQAGEVLSTASPEVLYALGTLKPYHLRALRKVFGNGFANLFEVDPEIVRSIGASFFCVEQIRDLGDALAVIHSAEAMQAVGRWETRDITEKVNEERSRRGQPEIKGRSFETDIGVGRRIIGPYFNTLMEEPPELIAAFGNLISRIRTMDKVERKDAIEEVRLFCDRFLEYVTTDAMKALGMIGKNPTGFGEALGIMEGLFSKPGLGRKFFENALQTPEGVRALAGLKEDIEEMKRRGSIKDDTDIKQLLQNSDILDGHLVPFISFK